MRTPVYSQPVRSTGDHLGLTDGSSNGGGVVRLSPGWVGSDAKSRVIISELNWTAGHPATVHKGWRTTWCGKPTHILVPRSLLWVKREKQGVCFLSVRQLHQRWIQGFRLKHLGTEWGYLLRWEQGERRFQGRKIEIVNANQNLLGRHPRELNKLTARSS